MNYKKKCPRCSGELIVKNDLEVPVVHCIYPKCDFIKNKQSFMKTIKEDKTIKEEEKTKIQYFQMINFNGKEIIMSVSLKTNDVQIWDIKDGEWKILKEENI